MQTKTNDTYESKHIEGKGLFRAAHLTGMRVMDEEKRTVELSYSSEGECERYFGIEILGHSTEEIRMDWLRSGNAPLLLDHDWEKQIGVIESASIGTDRKGRAVVRFGKSALAEEVYQDVKDGIRKNISVGYFINRMILEESGKDEMSDRYRVTDWEPFEVSIVAVPADRDVGIGRMPNGAHARKIEVLTPLHKRTKENTPMETQTTTAAPAATLASVDIKVIENDIRKKEMDRIKSIRAIAKAHNMGDFGDRAIESGCNIEQFQADLLEEMARTQPDKVRPIHEDDGKIGMTGREIQQFSLIRAINAVVNNAPELAPFEMEVARATREKYKHRSFSGKIQIPSDILLHKRQRQIAQRTLTAAGATSGAELVGTDHLGESFIDLLRGRLLVAQLGARFLSGLVGDVTIPKLVAGATAYWVVEGNAPSESTQTTGAVNLAPKTMGAWTDISRKLLLQSSPDAEMLVRDDLIKVMARELDRVAYNGSGAGGQPTGILNTSGIGAVDYDTGISFGDMVDLETEVSIDNADTGSLHYVTTPSLRGSMKQTEKATGTAQYIWQDGMVNGYPAHATSLMKTAEVLFGNFEDLIIANWGVLDLKVSEEALFTAGGVRVRVLQDVDMAVRHPESFARAFT